MNNLKKFLVVMIGLWVATAACAQKTEYIIKNVKGAVEYRLKPSDAWQPVKRLLTLPKSSTVKIGDGAEITVYSESNPQPLRITSTGENKLRTLINEAEKKSAEARGGELAHLLKGTGGSAQTVRSGASYRGPADQGIIPLIAKAVKTPVASTPKTAISLTLVKDEEGDYDVVLSNNSKKDLSVAVIVNTGRKYTALRISDDANNASLLELPAGVSLTIPECKVVGLEGIKAIAVGAEEIFSPETLCVVLNSPAEPENGGNATEKSAAVTAVEASIR